MNHRTFTHLIAFMILGIAVPARADLSLPKVLGDNMVLQRDRPVPIWGKAAAGEMVSVRFGDMEKKVRANEQGKWKLILDPMPASAEPRDLTITADKPVVLKNILVGEVWLCSGQSNMELPMARGGAYRPPRSGPDHMPQDLASANDPLLRLFKVEKVDSLPDVTTKTAGRNVKPILSRLFAVGYIFWKRAARGIEGAHRPDSIAWAGSASSPSPLRRLYFGVPSFKLTPATQRVEIDGVAPESTIEA